MVYNEETHDSTAGRRPLMRVEEGWDIVDAAGEKIGEVAQTYATFFVVSKGFFFPTDRYIPFSAVSRVDDDCAYLDLTKDEIDSRGWDNPDTVRNIDTSDVSGYDQTRATAMDTEYGTDAALSGQKDIELREERLKASKEREQTGSVRIGKDVETERETIEVPTERETVDVEYHPYDEARQASGDLTEDEVRVPVTEERVRAEKETVATGELQVNKRREQDTQRVSADVRKERARVEREGDVDVDTEGLDVDTNKP